MSLLREIAQNFLNDLKRQLQELVMEVIYLKVKKRVLILTSEALEKGVRGLKSGNKALINAGISRSTCSA